MNATPFRIDATRPFYAAVGAGEAALELARDYATELQARLEGLDLEPEALRELVLHRVEKAQSNAQTRVQELQTELQAQVNEFPTRAQSLINDKVAELSKNLDQYAARGKKVVSRLRGVEVVVTPTETVAVKTTPSKASTAKRSAAAKKAAAKRASSKPVTRRSTAKKA